MPTIPRVPPGQRLRAKTPQLPVVGIILLVVMAIGPTPASAGTGAGTGLRAGPTFGAPVTPMEVLTAFDPPSTPYGSGHRGVDLAAPTGTAIHAAGPGRIVYAGRLVDRGVVSVEHVSGLRTTYEPVTAAVTVGSSVTLGQVLGHLEPGHSSCAPTDCLHWGAKIGDRYLDPLSLIDGWQVRLLPWSAAPGTITSRVAPRRPQRAAAGCVFHRRRVRLTIAGVSGDQARGCACR